MKHKISESQINIIEKWLHNESFCKAHLGLEGAQFLRKVIYDGGYTDTSKKLLFAVEISIL